MNDREKVIKDLEECMNASCRGFRPRISCPYNDDEWDVMRDALALLKEQSDIVRCKDCVNYNINPEFKNEKDALGRCDNISYLVGPYWFCADGERRREDALPGSDLK